MTESSTQGSPAAFSYAGHGSRAAFGVAICHGFTGSPLSVLPWAEHLARLGFAVEVPLLPGHGTDWRQLAKSGWKEWYGCFERSYLALAGRTESTFVAGLSMGGAIAMRVAARHPVAGLALVNPGLTFYDRRVRFVSMLKYVMPTTDPIVEDEPTAEATDDGDYSRTPLAAVHELRKLFQSTRRSLPSITAPAVIFVSAVDAVVPPNSVGLIKRHIRSRELQIVPLPHSGHVATLDIDAPVIFDQSTDFFLRHAAYPVPSESS